MGINPFINKVTLMTDHLNANKLNAISSMHTKYNNDNHWNKNVKHNHNKSVFKSKRKPVSNDLDFSLHPEVNNTHNAKAKNTEQAQDGNNGEYGNWLNVESENKETMQTTKDTDSCLFKSIFNDNDDDEDS